MRDLHLDRRGFVSVAGASGLALLAGRTAQAPEQSETTTAQSTPILVGCAPLSSSDRGNEAMRATIAEARRSGVTALIVPVISTEHDRDAMRGLLRFRQTARKIADQCTLVDSAAELAAASAGGPSALVMHSHGLQWVGRNLSILAEFQASGLRLTKLCSGWRNLAADGCFEPTDLGLTALGRRAIAALNDARLVIDLAHTGRRSSLEAMRRSRHPVVFTHVNADAVHPHALNLTDEQIVACARAGGVIGVSASPALVSSAPATSGDVLRHLDHIVRLVGVDHVALGLDFDSRPEKRYPTDPIPDSLLQYPTGLARFGDLPAFAGLMASRGIGPTERAKVLGGNLERVLREVWER